MKDDRELDRKKMSSREVEFDNAFNEIVKHLACLKVRAISKLV